MKTKAIIAAVLLGTGLVLSGCGNSEATANNGQNQKQIQQEESNKNAEGNKKSDENKSDLNYSLKGEVLENEERNIKVNYPQINEFPGELSKDYINQSLRKIVESYENSESYSDVEIDYEITRMDENILSVVFKGTAKMEGIGDVTVQRSVNLDISSTNEISYNNLVKDGEKVREILNQKAIDNGIEGGLEAEGIRVYFNGDNVVFYYMPLDDSAKEFIELSVPQSELEGIINTEFGEHPAS
ncbi:hypothetical protein [Oceanirhabdus sp. W0125-5]|uniref:hypothetical protein n=1 Tax=Oceanirhabdus sp. W0125-5 TaxID=2999116 RepID=UPI0022F2F295|nr:hypothetical protein [Oceanirhabdus sp. W0125-5]WBW96863.1 hypothetical protein OW730_24710 [Oceanirhabdus sp. W0125-5]